MARLRRDRRVDAKKVIRRGRGAKSAPGKQSSAKGVGKAKRNGAARRPARPAGDAGRSRRGSLFDSMLSAGRSSGEFMGVILGTLECVNNQRDEVLVAAKKGGADWRKVGNRSASADVLKWKNDAARSRVAEALSAVGQTHRLVIMQTLLDGPAVYRTLQKVTKLKAGPLYHHIHQLRLASLVLPKQRDLYELTRAGRNLILIALGLEKLIKDVRRRPLGLAEAAP